MAKTLEIESCWDCPFKALIKKRWICTKTEPSTKINDKVFNSKGIPGRCPLPGKEG